jgi:hypothetical protein
MELTLVKVGLPVTCHTCKVKAVLKVGEGKAGWYRWTPLRGVSKWYCPEHAISLQRTRSHFADAHQTPKPKLNVEEELYALLD